MWRGMYVLSHIFLGLAVRNPASLMLCPFFCMVDLDSDIFKVDKLPLSCMFFWGDHLCFSFDFLTSQKDFTVTY